MTQPLSEEELRESITDLLPCVDSMCDKNGTTVGGTMDDPEPYQCQFCYQERFPAIDQIARLILQDRQAWGEKQYRSGYRAGWERGKRRKDIPSKYVKRPDYTANLQWRMKHAPETVPNSQRNTSGRSK